MLWAKHHHLVDVSIKRNTRIETQDHLLKKLVIFKDRLISQWRVRQTCSLIFLTCGKSARGFSPEAKMFCAKARSQKKNIAAVFSAKLFCKMKWVRAGIKNKYQLKWALPNRTQKSKIGLLSSKTRRWRSPFPTQFGCRLSTDESLRRRSWKNEEATLVRNADPRRARRASVWER